MPQLDLPALKQEQRAAARADNRVFLHLLLGPHAPPPAIRTLISARSLSHNLIPTFSARETLQLLDGFMQDDAETAAPLRGSFARAGLRCIR